ncbi:JAB domain-containing protein [Castellaniella hirudinis]|uniref:JAB domain-containing protein n=1 Tax=Castellaniella ginsengisoli TaxID=546114 RepID=A0AB39EXN5_9BURK
MKTNSTAALSYDNMNDAHPLYVRSPSGRYKLATDDQILAAGRVAAESLISVSNPMAQPARVVQFFQAKLAGLGHECAAFLYLDAQLKPIRYIEQAFGTLCHASIYPREIVKTALRVNAAALLMAHNHPSGLAEPSAPDVSMTRQLKQALALVDIRLLDHVVVAATQAVSLAERGQV